MNVARFALAVLCLCVGTLNPLDARAQIVANGPYYATPSWDQSMPAGTRFVVLANMNSGAVLDRETGLVWQRSPSATASSLFGTQFRCLDSNVGGRKGWRLPTASELLSLFDPAATAPPYLPAGHPFTGFNARSQFFWTSTPALGAAGLEGLYASLGYTEVPPGGVFAFGTQGTSPSGLNFALCVRAPE